MDHATQVALMRRIFGFLERRTTELAAAPYVNRVTTYTSSQQLERERDTLFRGEPLFVGLSGDAPEPGAYFVHTDTGVPILILRAASRELRAFLGICRHRGAQVASGSGVGAGRFVCPYHGWTYDESGRLVSAPCREGFSGLDPQALHLRPLPLVERYGMIFVRATPGDPIDIDAQLAGAQQELAAFGLEGYVPFARHEVEKAMNWKLVIDTFLEAYHVPTLHEHTLSPTILGTPALWDAFGRSSRLVAVRRSIAEMRTRPESEWNLLQHSVVLYNIFPNTMLIYQVDHVEIVQAYPGADADSAKIVFTFYTPGAVTTERARRHFQANLDLLLTVTVAEDFRIGEQIQRGFHAKGHDTVIYGRNEPGVAHYHRMIKAAIDAVSRDGSAASRDGNLTPGSTIA
jgi:phenylpropionate dioxygenase-like ring-hydroxylating dioxygenase large terminal subunit